MKLLITAGPTREYFDPIRFITNASSGQMGYAIATAAIHRGHAVHLVSGPVALTAPQGAEMTRVETAEEMLEASLAAFCDCDAAVMTAAVSDWRPVVRHATKLPKVTVEHPVAFEPTPDICARLGAEKQHRVVIGFAVQDADPHARAEAKLHRKHCDAIILNRPETLGSADATIEILVAGGSWQPPQRASKSETGDVIVRLCESLVSRADRDGA
jgi:phosphopantothenoylcysteine decarboxylase/phosphopantothenate--cysteine ligase